MEHTLPEVKINRDGAGTLAAQLISQIKQALLRDRLLPGSVLPSVRQLSTDLDLDGETVARAYRTLASDSIIRPSRFGGPSIDLESKATLHRLAALTVAQDRGPSAEPARPAHWPVRRRDVLDCDCDVRAR